MTEKLVPKFALRCTRKLKTIYRPGVINELPELNVWVDTRGKRLTDIDDVPISDTNSFQANDREIRFRIRGANTVIADYVLDRVSGALSAQVSDQRNPVVGKVIGTCEKTDTIEKKF